MSPVRKLFIPIFLAVLFLGIFGLVNVVEAQEPPGPLPWGLGEFKIENPLAADTFEEVLDRLINFIFWVGITVAPVMLIIAGFMLVTALGDPKRVETAKKMILYTLIGLAIVILAKGLIAVLKSILGVTGG